MEYSGYNPDWVIEQGIRGYHYEPEQDVDSDQDDSDQDDIPQQAQLEWETEIPVKLRVSVHSEKSKRKLAESLRDLEGVYDVGIQGTSNALVTVTGTASKLRVLERARTIFTDAEPWSED